LTGVHFSASGSTDATYTYNAVNLRTAMTDATGTSSYTYNGVGEMASETDGAGMTIGYSYNSTGQLASITYPGSKTVHYGYDADDQMTSLTDSSSNETDFTWTNNGQLSTQSDPNGVSQTRTYDADGQTTDISTATSSGTLANFEYGYDDAGELTSDSTTDPNNSTAVTHAYNYDQVGQLTTVNNGTATAGYTATSGGLLTGNTAGSSLSYNSAQELTSLAPGSGPSTSYTYDDNGSRTSATVASTESTSATTTAYSYDPAGNLSAVDLPSIGGGAAETVDYTSDGDGLRQSRTVGSTTKNFLWDTASSTPLLLDDGTNSYLYGPSTAPIAEINDSTGAIHYLSSDLIGSTRLVTTSTGTVSGVSIYDEYGNVVSRTGATNSPFGYSGNWTDPDTGLVYLRARDYDPATAQFLTVDPAVDSTRQPYAYVANDPLAAVDPNGDCGQSVQWWNPSTWDANAWQTAGSILAGIVAGAIVAAAIVGATACTAITFGVCGAIILGSAIAAGAVSGGITYALQPGPKSLSGFGESVGFGAIGGLFGGVLGSIGGKLLSVGLSRVASSISSRAAQSATTTVFRVESAANARVAIGDDGGVAISGANMLFLNIGDAARAVEFQAQRLGQGFSGTVVKSFDVSSEYTDELLGRAVPEAWSRGSGATVLQVDVTKTATSVGLRASEFEGLQSAIVPGSGK
jgi:RHS repeat-associated protein